MNLNRFLRSRASKIFIIGTLTICLANGYFLDDDEYAQDPAEDRTGTIPRLNITTYLNTAMEPHNAMVQVTQNWLNFCMGTMFWFTSAAIYYRVNPPKAGSYTGRSFEDEEEPGLYKIFKWVNSLDEEESGRSIDDSPLTSFANTFSTVLTGVANAVETASR
jgi:hypothetical protein